MTKTIPAGTKIYATLAACCHYQSALPGGVQPVFTGDADRAGFACLPEFMDGHSVTWIAPHSLADVSVRRARIARIRAAIRARYPRHRIVSDEVHVYGPMPNAPHISGWWLMGSLSHAEDWLGLDN